ncbi:type IV toxin-antitoxin system AbiEi family antitoxin domain-containing protein [Arthrobacter sp. Hor0625]|uniref:type IV toxin-antitoxin system AbiEi family antitoxin domain-containing protein n=1 Tax=Arthrobacter sp. Hor0625 TaxID=3457358 RepID=UPI00403E3BB0
MEIPAFILSSDSARLGRDTRALSRRAAAGELRRIRRGVYVQSSDWDRLPNWARYPVLVQAAASTLHSRTVFCRKSSAALWDLPVLGRPQLVHACTTDDGGGRSGAGVVRHYVDPRSLEIEERRGLLVTSRLRTVLDLAAYESFEQAIAALDHVLCPRPGLPALSRPELHAGVGDNYSAAAARRIRTAIDFADPASESPGESVSRALMHRLGFKPATLQAEVCDARGRVGFTDFEWPDERLCGEFDGLVKYQKPEYLRGRTPSQVVVEEKLREDRIRATGRRVVRWTWTEISGPARFEAFLTAERVPRLVRPACRP